MSLEVYGQSTYPLDFDLTNFGRFRLSEYTTFSQNLSVTYMLQLFIGPSIKTCLILNILFNKTIQYEWIFHFYSLPLDP
jgi:hypothetical protein